MRIDERDSHVEYANNTKSPRVPLSHVAFHGGFHRISEFSNDWDGPWGAGEMLFLVPVHGLLEDEECGDDSEGGVKPSCLVGGRKKERRDGDVSEGGGDGGGTRDRGGIVAKEGRHDGGCSKAKLRSNSKLIRLPRALIGYKKSVEYI